MADPNTMQTGMGLVGGVTPFQSPPTPSPAETSLRLMEQAQQQVQIARQNITQVVSSVSQQFQANYDALKSSTYISPQMAQALHASRTPGYSAEDVARNPFGRSQDSMLPSPLLMTPSETGVFRPRQAPFNFTPLPPITMPSFGNRMLAPTGLGVGMPFPNYQSYMAQQTSMMDVMSMNTYAQASQVPGMMATGLGFGAAAFAGGRMGRGIGGRWGAAIGAGLGAIGAGAVGIPQALGGLADTLSGIPFETIQMGASLQNSTRGFVTGGLGMSPMGRGLSRESSRQLASGIRDMASEDSMFNRADYMSIINQGGAAGLFDMAQSVPDIKNKLKETASTIKQFMQLTNDPDITNVIRQMGQMHQMGMTQSQMVQAAQGMRMYAKQAGTTIQGLQAMGGTPGAYMFQQAGMTAGLGFQYGNFAAANARGVVASGNMSSQQLALLGGVSGMTQRDIMAQASFAGMPLYAAMNGQYGAGGWGAGAGGGFMAPGGAAGMVTGAYQALSGGVQGGGLGALAMFGLQQRQVADSAMSKMTPGEMMAQRYMMALNTGKMFGMSGMAALGMGAQSLFTKDVAEQMVATAGTPGAMNAALRGNFMQQQEVGMQQGAGMRNTQGFLPDRYTAGPAAWAARQADRFTSSVSNTFGAFSEALADLPFVGTIPTGMVRFRTGSGGTVKSQKQLDYMASAEGQTLLRRSGAAGALDAAGVEAANMYGDLQAFKAGADLSGKSSEELFRVAKDAGLTPSALSDAVSALEAETAKYESTLGQLLSGDLGDLESSKAQHIKNALNKNPAYAKASPAKKRQMEAVVVGMFQKNNPNSKFLTTQKNLAESANNYAQQRMKDVTAAEQRTRSGLYKTFTDISPTGAIAEKFKDFLMQGNVGAKDVALLMASSTSKPDKKLMAAAGVRNRDELAMKSAALKERLQRTGVAPDAEIRGLLRDAAATPGGLGALRGLQESYMTETMAGIELSPANVAAGADPYQLFASAGTGDLTEIARRYRTPLAQKVAAGKASETERKQFLQSLQERTTGGPVTEVSATAAGGEEGSRLKRDADALRTLGAEFATFGSAVNQFAAVPQQLDTVLKRYTDLLVNAGGG